MPTTLADIGLRFEQEDRQYNFRLRYGADPLFCRNCVAHIHLIERALRGSGWHAWHLKFINLNLASCLGIIVLNIVASSVSELVDRLRAINIAVSPRTVGRTTEQCERWSICRFLSTYAETGLLEYPLKIAKRERPDFLLTLPSRRVGVEITEAVPPDWARADARREKLNLENLVFLHRFRPGEPRRSRGEIDAIARGASRGEGWAGDAPEREWADAMLHFAHDKAATFAKPGYEQFENNWLLIYDNWPLPAVDYPKAASYLAQQIVSLRTPLSFDRIFVVCEHSIWQFGDSSCVPSPIRDLWANS